MAKLVILEPAQREIEDIALLHLRLSSPNSARKITDLIYDTIGRLELFPRSGHPPKDHQLAKEGYSYVIAGKYIAVCRYLEYEDTVYVYHIAHGASNYPALFKSLLRSINYQR